MERKTFARDDLLFETALSSDKMNFQFGMRFFNRSRDGDAGINMAARAAARDDHDSG